MTFPISDHFNGRSFFNPSGPQPKGFSAVPRMILERRSTRTPWPRFIDEPTRVPAPLDDASAVVTFIGHATFLIQTAAGNILTDPVYSNCAGPFNRIGPRRVRRPAVRFEDLPAIALVLLSHNHYDHCDRPTLARLAQRFDPLIVTPLGNQALVRSTGIRRVEELDWWQPSSSAPLPISLTPAHHFSARSPFDRNRALWGGFMITVGSKRIYFAGDTAYASFFPEIPRRLGAIDLALLPIGAYEPRWFMRAVHMNPAESVQAHLELGLPETIAMHYATFPMTLEGIDEPVRALDEACVARNVSRARFRTLGFGESVRVR